MTDRDLVVVGSGGHAKMLIDMAEQLGGYRIVGVVSTDTDKKEFRGYPVLGSHEVLPDVIKRGVGKALIGVGGLATNEPRRRVYEELKGLGFEIETLVHPSAILEGRISFGEGAVVGSGCVLQTEVQLGVNAVCYTKTGLGHETVLEDHSLLSGDVSVGGNVRIGEGAWIGLAAVISAGVAIAPACVVGAGAVVIKDLEEPGVYVGVPARRIGPLPDQE